MTIVFQVVAAALFLFLILLFARVVISLLHSLARDWRAKGAVAAAFEGVYAVTDPPVRAVRRVVPPLNVGAVRLDLGFMIVFFVTYIAYTIFQRLA